MQDKNYLFKSERLGFRNWLATDIDAMSAINADPLVMEFFPSVQTKEHTIQFIEKMQKHFVEKGFCYFAVDKLEDGNFIGFIGICEQTFESDFTPYIDVGWCLNQKEWNKGFATEGAKKCLEFAFKQLDFEKVNAVCPKINRRSENVMKKSGMKKAREFVHPLLLNDERLCDCVFYEMNKKIFA
ncbi:MAG: GNAT family N-acetyltransferase [Bacteroidia bacterium]